MAIPFVVAVMAAMSIIKGFYGIAVIMMMGAACAAFMATYPKE